MKFKNHPQSYINKGRKSAKCGVLFGCCYLEAKSGKQWKVNLIYGVMSTKPAAFPGNVKNSF